ncbi:MAG: hypothetical protein AAGC57_03820 [Pseudomonadota bacterium]
MGQVVKCVTFAIDLDEELNSLLAKVQKRCAGEGFVLEADKGRFRHKDSKTEMRFQVKGRENDRLYVEAVVEDGKYDGRKLRVYSRKWFKS